MYEQSVICAPEYGPELSLAYGNRYILKILTNVYYLSDSKALMFFSSEFKPTP